MAIGAMGGAGVSLLTGAIVGPLAGAAIGAGVGLVAKSERVQNWLFGELDEDTGERKGGFIPKNIQDKLTMSPEFKEKLKAAAPRMAAGGIAGLGVSALLGGPFGVAGNLIVGAGLGYLSTSDKFHEYMFGENGLAYTLHDKIFTHVDPPDQIFQRSRTAPFYKRSAGISKPDRFSNHFIVRMPITTV